MIEEMRIAFAGASGTGKTTLAKWVSEKYSVLLNPIGARSVAKAMGFDTPYDVDKAGKRGDFQQRLQIDKIKWESEHESFVTDRTSLDELAYTSIHDVNAVDAAYWAAAQNGWLRYSLIFYLPVYSFQEIGSDPARHADITYHRVFDAVLRGLFGGRSVITLGTSDLEERKAMIGHSIRYRF